MKKTKKKAKLKTFYVGVNVLISGCEIVLAKNAKDAVKKAKKQYFSKGFEAMDTYTHGIEDACIDVDFSEEDEVEIEA